MWRIEPALSAVYTAELGERQDQVCLGYRVSSQLAQET